ncbi:hypothetical protein [Streptomyces sp. NPDC020983]|uniref:hypothetical protein n=1 Tax=Streptomyces sp. NPDC020983 TaxID=3365106 RepID=UPI00379DCD80
MAGVNPDVLAGVWRRLLGDPHRSWVLFEHGTCVVLAAPEGDLAAQAAGILREFGPVHVGTPAADFDVIDLADAPGWVVTGRHQDVLTYVSPEELDDHGTFSVGLFGRSKRHDDGTELHVVHVEDRLGGGAAGR